ncbi:MAG: GNAT family N-acetyltransferase [Brevinema sp.]
MIIRKYLDQDRLDIQRLGELFTLTPYVVDQKFQTLSNISIPLLVVTQFQNSNIQIYVAVEQNKIIAFISFIIENEFSYYTAYRCASILFLAVDSKYQKQGIGSCMLDYVFKECRKQRISIVRVGTDHSNTALSLYQKKEFRTILIWNICRIYRDEILLPNDKIPLKTNHLNFDHYPMEAILKRPVPWFYEPLLSNEGVHRFLIKKVRDQLYQENIKWVSSPNRGLSLLIKQDHFREQYYGIKGTLWILNDLYGNDGKKLSEFLKTVITYLPDMVMAEYWVPNQDKITQTILHNAGMKIVYQGISLVKQL